MPPVLPSFSGSVPDQYERHFGPLMFEPYALDLAARVQSRAIESALEVACGTGRVTRHLRRVLPAAARLVATDINPGMMAVGQRTLAGEAIDWQVADAQALPFPDASFDLVVCQFGLMFVPNKAQACREAFRVLRPGGRFLFNTWDRVEHNPAAQLSNDLITTYFPAPPPFFSIPFSMHDEGMLRGLLQDAGFKNPTASSVKKEGRSESALSAAIGFVEGNPIAMTLRERDPALIPKIRESVQYALADRFGDQPLISPLQAWVCEGQK